MSFTNKDQFHLQIRILEKERQASLEREANLRKSLERVLPVRPPIRLKAQLFETFGDKKMDLKMLEDSQIMQTSSRAATFITKTPKTLGKSGGFFDEEDDTPVNCGDSDRTEKLSFEKEREDSLENTRQESKKEYTKLMALNLYQQNKSSNIEKKRFSLLDTSRQMMNLQLLNQRSFEELKPKHKPIEPYVKSPKKVSKSQERKLTDNYQEDFQKEKTKQIQVYQSFKLQNRKSKTRNQRIENNLTVPSQRKIILYQKKPSPNEAKKLQKKFEEILMKLKINQRYVKKSQFNRIMAQLGYLRPMSEMNENNLLEFAQQEMLIQDAFFMFGNQDFDSKISLDDIKCLIFGIENIHQKKCKMVRLAKNQYIDLSKINNFEQFHRKLKPWVELKTNLECDLKEQTSQSEIHKIEVVKKSPRDIQVKKLKPVERTIKLYSPAESPKFQDNILHQIDQNGDEISSNEEFQPQLNNANPDLRPLFILDVNIGSRQNRIVAPLKIFPNDNHSEVVKEFSSEHGLNFSKSIKLLKVVYSYLDSYKPSMKKREISVVEEQVTNEAIVSSVDEKSKIYSVKGVAGISELEDRSITQIFRADESNYLDSKSGTVILTTDA